MLSESDLLGGILQEPHFRFNKELGLLSFPCFVVALHAKSPRIVDRSLDEFSYFAARCSSKECERTERKAVPIPCSQIDTALARSRSTLGMLCLRLKTFENSESTSYTAFCLARCSRTSLCSASLAPEREPRRDAS